MLIVFWGAANKKLIATSVHTKHNASLASFRHRKMKIRSWMVAVIQYRVEHHCWYRHITHARLWNFVNIDNRRQTVALCIRMHLYESYTVKSSPSSATFAAYDSCSCVPQYFFRQLCTFARMKEKRLEHSIFVKYSDNIFCYAYFLSFFSRSCSLAVSMIFIFWAVLTKRRQTFRRL